MSAIEHVVLGHVVGVYGVRGWVKVHSDTQPRENITQYARWWLRHAKEWREVTVVRGRRQGKNVLAQIAGVDTREQAEKLIGLDISINRAMLPELDADEYYWTDLIGCRVVDTEGRPLGVLVRLFETGANDVMVVQNPDSATPSAELLIPWIAPTVVTSVQLAERVVSVDWDVDYLA